MINALMRFDWVFDDLIGFDAGLNDLIAKSMSNSEAV